VVDKHKWWVLAYFLALFAWAVIGDMTGGTNLPEFIFLGSMVAWFIVFELIRWGRDDSTGEDGD